MIQLKNPRDLTYSAFQVCMVEKCTEESEKIFPTDHNVIDVCFKHFKQLEAEKYST